MLELRDARKIHHRGQIHDLDRHIDIGGQVLLQTDVLRQWGQHQLGNRHIVELAIKVVERALQFERDTLEVLISAIGIFLTGLQVLILSTSGLI